MDRKDIADTRTYRNEKVLRATLFLLGRGCPTIPLDRDLVAGVFRMSLRGHRSSVAFIYRPQMSRSSYGPVTPEYKPKELTYGDGYSGYRIGDPDLHDLKMENDENIAPAAEFIIGKPKYLEGILYLEIPSLENPGRRVPSKVLYESTEEQAMQTVGRDGSSAEEGTRAVGYSSD